MAAKKRTLTVPEKHQLKIARQTLKMSEAGALIMGGPNHAEAREIIKHLTGKAPKENPVQRKTKKRRTPAQKAATAKLVALNKKRRGKKKTRRKVNPKRKVSKVSPMDWRVYRAKPFGRLRLGGHVFKTKAQAKKFAEEMAADTGRSYIVAPSSMTEMQVKASMSGKR